MSETQHNVEEVTVGQILGDLSEYRLAIPLYQRPYRWTTDEASLLLSDLQALFEERRTHPQTHYSLGTLVTVQKGKTLEILDGQQRLTTVWLLRAALKAKVAVPDSSQRVEREAKALDTLEKTQHVIDFQNEEVNLEDREAFLASSRGLVLRFFLEERVKHEEQTTEITDDALLDLLENAVDLRLVNVPLSSGNTSEQLREASEMFDIINARGIPLSILDVLKAELIARLPEHQQHAFDEAWCAIQEAVERQDLSLTKHLPLFAREKKLQKSDDSRETQCEQSPDSLGFTIKDIVDGKAFEGFATTQTHNVRPDDSLPLKVKAPISFTMLLVSAREIWKVKNDIELPEAMSTTHIWERFAACLRSIDQSDDKAQKVLDFMAVLKRCAQFCIEVAPYRALNDKHWRWMSHSSLAQLQQSFMAARNFQDDGQYWFLLGASLYDALGDEAIKNRGAFVEVYEKALGYFAHKQCMSTLKTAEVLALAKTYAQGERGQAIAFHVDRIRYPERWPFFWVDWLLIQDFERNPTSNMPCYREAFKDIVNFDDLEVQKTLQDMALSTDVRIWSSLEHWLPQTDERRLSIESGTSDLRDSFANVALIDSSLNSQLSNKRSEQKRAISLKDYLEEGAAEDGQDAKATPKLSPKLRTLVALKKRDGELQDADLPIVNQAWQRFIEMAYRRYVLKAL